MGQYDQRKPGSIGPGRTTPVARNNARSGTGGSGGIGPGRGIYGPGKPPVSPSGGAGYPSGQPPKSPNPWAIIAIVAAVAVVVTFLCVGNGLFRKSGENSESGTSDISGTAAADNTPHAINDPFPANDSGNVQTPEETMANLRERGFDDATLYVNVDMEGNTISPVTPHEGMDEKYPSYVAIMGAEQVNDVPWILYFNNGEIYAKAPYVFEDEPDATIVLTEKDYITAYDADTGQYTKMIPDDERLIVLMVDHIDSQTLASMTVEKLKELDRL